MRAAVSRLFSHARWQRWSRRHGCISPCLSTALHPQQSGTGENGKLDSERPGFLGVHRRRIPKRRATCRGNQLNFRRSRMISRQPRRNILEATKTARFQEIGSSARISRTSENFPIRLCAIQGSHLGDFGPKRRRRQTPAKILLFRKCDALRWGIDSQFPNSTVQRCKQSFSTAPFH